MVTIRDVPIVVCATPTVVTVTHVITCTAARWQHLSHISDTAADGFRQGVCAAIDVCHVKSNCVVGHPTTCSQYRTVLEQCCPLDYYSMIVYINFHSKPCSCCFHISAWSALYHVVVDHISDCVCLSVSCLSAYNCLSVSLSSSQCVCLSVCLPRSVRLSVSRCLSVVSMYLCWVLIGRVTTYLPL